MIAALDVHYRSDDSACAACVGFDSWSDASPRLERAVEVAHVAPYEPGSFYLRELPCLLAILARVEGVSTIVVDAYVDLDASKPGLGRRLFVALDDKVPVIGVAKSHYAGAAGVEVFRGSSKSPLYVSAAGVDVDEAARNVRSMHGASRIPTLLTRVDDLARGR